MDRAYGKAPSFNTTHVGEFRRAVDLSDDELIRIALAGGVQIEPPTPKPAAQDAPGLLPPALPSKAPSTSTH